MIEAVSMKSKRALICALSVVALRTLEPAIAHADGPDARKEATHAFLEGEKAFKGGDYVVAGEAFDRAYSLAPHHDVLWNSARAWQRAGEVARAANLYARFILDAPPDAADRPKATAELAQLASKLGKIEVQAAPSDTVWIDGAILERRFLYVIPGAHLVRIKSGDRDESTTEKVGAGAVVSVAQRTLVPPPSPPAQSAPPPSAAPSEPSPSGHGWSPMVVWIGAGATLAVAGIAVWSGVDTLNAKNEFDAAPTQSQLDSGHGKETRTNVLIGASAGLLVLTGVAAVWLVDWHGGKNVKVGVGAGTLSIAGRF